MKRKENMHFYKTIAAGRLLCHYILSASIFIINNLIVSFSSNTILIFLANSRLIFHYSYRATVSLHQTKAKWSKQKTNTLGDFDAPLRQFLSICDCRMYNALQGLCWPGRRLNRDPYTNVSSIPSSLHFSRHNRLSSHKTCQYRQVWAARNKSLGSRNDKTYNASCTKTKATIQIEITNEELAFTFKV